ncbi:MAG: radical SAM protein, partial [Nitrososphaerales archaeon]
RLETIIEDSSAAKSLEKALNFEKLNFQDGLAIMQSDDLHLIGRVADNVRERICGNKVSFVQSYNMNYTNYCVARCPICAFYRPYKKGVKAPDGYTLSLDEAINQIKDAVSLGATEIHIVGGFNPELPVEYYEGLFRKIKGRWPQVTIKALTLAEISYIAKITRNSVGELFERLKLAGLDAHTGGGAEIFDPDIRAVISTPPKCSSSEWLQTAEIAHNLGVPGNSTMLYGHVERPEHIVDHMLKLRDSQDKSPGFLSFIPLKFSPGNTELLKSGKVKEESSSPLDLKVIATARLLLMNSINNISIYWVALGTELAQVALGYGGNDLVGTAFSEKVYGATGRNELVTIERLAHLVRGVGRIPIERDTFYEELRAL